MPGPELLQHAMIFKTIVCFNITAIFFGYSPFLFPWRCPHHDTLKQDFTTPGSHHWTIILSSLLFTMQMWRQRNTMTLQSCKCLPHSIVVNSVLQDDVTSPSNSYPSRLNIRSSSSHTVNISDGRFSLNATNSSEIKRLVRGCNELATECLYMIHSFWHGWWHDL